MSLQAQSSATPPALGLLRLKGAAKPNEAVPLATNKFSIDDLSPSGAAGAAKGRKNNADYLALDAGREWSRPLRGSLHDVTFVSFQLQASQTTIINIAGARLGLTAGPFAGSLQLMYDDSVTGALQWKPLGYHVPTERYGGKNLSALPTLTVRIDPDAGTWDLFSGSRLLADDLPLIVSKKNDRKFVLTAGAEGAWISGLVFADENPLYEDANANGIDDRFEISRRGSLLPVNSSDRHQLASAWKESQRDAPPPAFFVQRPRPDAQ